METVLTEVPATAASDTRWIDISLIDIPTLARRHDPDRVASLADDMTINGQLQEIVVVPKGERFEVAAGVGRTAAARKLAWEKIRCLVKGELSEFDRLRITFAENEEREDVSPIYQAQLLEKMKISGNFKDQAEMANKMSKSPGLLSQYFSLLDLQPDVQEKFNALNLTLRQVLELKRLPNADLQLRVGAECAKSDLSGKALKARVDQLIPAEGAGEQAGKGAKKPVEDLVWKGGKIIINRPFDPASETAESYIAWLTQALPAFAAVTAKGI
jgi:ParB/RepB/Spo0J family partition protein